MATLVATTLRGLMGRVPGMNPTRLGDETGVHQSTIWKILNGKIKDPGTDVLKPLAQRFGISVAQLRGELPLPADLSYLAPSDASVVAIPVYNVEPSAGGGRVSGERDTIVGSMQLSQDWLRRNVSGITSQKNLAVMTADGSSMSPTILDGDILLVDRGITEIKNNKVHVLLRDDELFVKRLQRRMNGDLLIKSDNPLLESETLPANELAGVRVTALVLYAWNGRQLL